MDVGVSGISGAQDTHHRLIDANFVIGLDSFNLGLTAPNHRLALRVSLA